MIKDFITDDHGYCRFRPDHGKGAKNWCRGNGNTVRYNYVGLKFYYGKFGPDKWRVWLANDYLEPNPKLLMFPLTGRDRQERLGNMCKMYTDPGFIKLLIRIK